MENNTNTPPSSLPHLCDAESGSSQLYRPGSSATNSSPDTPSPAPTAVSQSLVDSANTVFQTLVHSALPTSGTNMHSSAKRKAKPGSCIPEPTKAVRSLRRLGLSFDDLPFAYDPTQKRYESQTEFKSRRVREGLALKNFLAKRHKPPTSRSSSCSPPSSPTVVVPPDCLAGAPTISPSHAADAIDIDIPASKPPTPLEPEVIIVRPSECTTPPPLPAPMQSNSLPVSESPVLRELTALRSQIASLELALERERSARKSLEEELSVLRANSATPSPPSTSAVASGSELVSLIQTTVSELLAQIFPGVAKNPPAKPVSKPAPHSARQSQPAAPQPLMAVQCTPPPYAPTSVAPSPAPLVLQEVTGDLFSAPEDFALAHCVAADFRMSAGIATRFKAKFGDVDHLLRQGRKVGQVAFLRKGNRYVFYLITKNESHLKPTLKSLRKAVYELRRHCDEFKVANLAIPRLGCGLDQLDWPTVRQIIAKAFRNSATKVTVYAPSVAQPVSPLAASSAPSPAPATIPPPPPPTSVGQPPLASWSEVARRKPRAQTYSTAVAPSQSTSAAQFPPLRNPVSTAVSSSAKKGRKKRVQAKVSPAKPTSKENTVLLLPRSPGNDVRTALQRTTSLDPRSLSITKTVPFPSGALLIACRDSADADKIRQTALATGQLSCKDAPPPRPYQARLFLVPADTTVGDLQADLSAQCGGEAIAIRFSPPGDSSTVTAYLDLPQHVFKALEQRRSLRVGWVRCPVHTGVHITRCSKCRLLGHPAKHCKTEARPAPSADQPCLDCCTYNDGLRKARLPRYRYRNSNHPTNASDCPTKLAFLRKRAPQGGPSPPTLVSAPLPPRDSSHQSPAATACVTTTAMDTSVPSSQPAAQPSSSSSPGCATAERMTVDL